MFVILFRFLYLPQIITLRVDPNCGDGKNENTRVASPECFPFHVRKQCIVMRHDLRRFSVNTVSYTEGIVLHDSALIVAFFVLISFTALYSVIYFLFSELW